VTAAGFVLAALLRLQAADQIVVTAAPSIDAQRLADALRVYLDEFGIRVETRGAGGEADDLRKRIDDARQLGEALRAVAVVRAEHGARGTIEIELIDGRRVVKPHGDSQMPVWGDAFAKSATESDERAIKAKIEALVRYLESIQERPAR